MEEKSGFAIYIDADGCPTKKEVYKVARRHDLKVYVVAARHLSVPRGRIQAVAAGDRFDGADDWIVEHLQKDDIVITADLPLTARCLEKGARVVNHKGREHTDSTIGDALAIRELRENLRQMGIDAGGPAPMGKKDRSRFLSRLEAVIQSIKGAHRG